jgi:hypothetical protein
MDFGFFSMVCMLSLSFIILFGLFCVLAWFVVWAWLGDIFQVWLFYDFSLAVTSILIR